MLYARSLQIEKRLEQVLGLIQTGGYSTPRLAELVGVSIPTISRIVAALRMRGHDIKAEKTASGWIFVHQTKPASMSETPIHRGGQVRSNDH